MIKKTNNAFTIIELAIVTVIIAIIVGAVLAGSDLLDGSKRSAIIKEINQYKTAIHNFKIQYEAIPGDMENASSYWRTTTDGDGNGFITGSTTENRYAWDQLSKSEIIKQSFDTSTLFKDRPKSDSGSIYYNLDTSGENGGGNNWNFGVNSVYGISNNYIGAGGLTEDSFYHASAGFINAADTESIDKKIDDGNASAGKLVAIKGLEVVNSVKTFHDGCVTGAVDAYETPSNYGLIDYDLNAKENGCRLIYFLEGLN